MHHRVARITAVLVATIATACAPARRGGDHERLVLQLDALDYAFAAPDTLRAGLITLRMHNRGIEYHHAQLVRLEQGRSFADLAAAIRQGGHGPSPSWLRHVGGPGAAAPGDSSDATLELTPGRYAVLCLIPGPDGQPHLAKGMMKPIEVVAGAPAPPVRSDLVMVLDDYNFELSGVLRPGVQTIEVTNAAGQPHEVVVARLEPGSTAQEFLTWAMDGAQGEPAGRFLGGTVGLDRGERNWITLDLVPGRYLLLCFLPDAADHRPHVAHGMIRQLEVH
jgi:hypothetical protein